MLTWFAELKRLKEKYFPPFTARHYICCIIVTLIFITANSMLEAWLGFGSGRQFSDIPNVLLSAFWAGGVSVFVIHVLVWIEMLMRKLSR